MALRRPDIMTAQGLLMRLNLRHISTKCLFSVIVRPRRGGKSGNRKLRYHDIILTAGAVTHHQRSRVIPAHNDTHMGIIRVKCQIPRLGLGPCNVGAVGMLGTCPSPVADNVAAIADIIKYPVGKPGTVQAEGPVSAGSGVSPPQ